MDPIALYYPYIHVRDDTWLKYAALYWPKLARLRPEGYPTLDSPVSRALREEAGWLLDVTPPPWAALRIGNQFLKLIAEHSHELRARFGVDRSPHDEYVLNLGALRRRPRRSVEPSSVGPDAPPWHAYVHSTKLSTTLLDAAVDAGLATTLQGRGGVWAGMHPELASVYTCALVEHIAAENHLHPITDQELPHSAASGWTVERLAEVLLSEPSLAPGPPARPDIADAFVFLAFETVVPAGLEALPVEKIIEVRTEFGAELDAFRRYVTEQSQQLAALQDVRDVEVFREYLRGEVDHAVTEQLKQLRERLRGVGLESARGLVNIKSVALPPLAAMAAEAAGLPASITGPAALAACVVTAPAHWRRQRRDVIRESPVGYLFRVDRKLNPAKLITRLRRGWPG